MSKNKKIWYGDNFPKSINEDISGPPPPPDPDTLPFTFDSIEITFDSITRTFDEI
jgi:hypothetical protein